jgi:hypothetical protein
MSKSSMKWRTLFFRCIHFHRLVLILVATGTWALSVSPTVEAAPGLAEGSIWELPGSSTEERWLEVHLIEDKGKHALYHISILGKLKGDPPWKIKHVVPHMAVTDAAIRRSGLRYAPWKRGSYPESYNDAYRQWLKLKTEGDAPICATSVVQCAHL